MPSIAALQSRFLGVPLPFHTHQPLEPVPIHEVITLCPQHQVPASMTDILKHSTNVLLLGLVPQQYILHAR